MHQVREESPEKMHAHSKPSSLLLYSKLKNTSVVQKARKNGATWCNTIATMAGAKFG